MSKVWAFWFHYLTDDVYVENTFSLWCGSLLLVFNVVVRLLAHDNIVLLEWTRPVCEVILVAGNLMTAIVAARMPALFPRTIYAFSFFAHTALGVSVYGIAYTLNGTLVCVGALLTALLVYWILEVRLGGAWPYPLSPFEVAVFCVTFLCVRLV